MKKLLSAIIILGVIFTLFAPSAAAAENLIKNGDFESSDMSQYNDLQLGMPDNMPVIVSGGRSGNCIEMGGDREGFGWPTWTNFRIGNLPLKKDYKYKLEGWVRGTEKITLTLQTHLFSVTAGANKHREVYHSISSYADGAGIPVTSTWTKFSIDFTMTNLIEATNKLIIDASDWNILFQYDTYWATPQPGVTFPQSSIYFDDLVLTETGKAPPPASSVQQQTPSSSAPQQNTSSTPVQSANTSVQQSASQPEDNSGTDELPDASEPDTESDNTESNQEDSQVSVTSKQDDKKDGGEGAYLLIIIILLAVILVGGGAALFFLVIKKKPETK